MCLRYIGTMILTRERSEEEKLRRHLYGDKGAKFSGGKIPKVSPPEIIGTITTFITKDTLLMEIYEAENHPNRSHLEIRK